MINVTNKGNKRDMNWFRFLYCGFILLSIYYVFIVRDYSAAVTNLAIALAFDPFDQKLSWANRPIWQRGWLIIHLGFVLVGFCSLK